MPIRQFTQSEILLKARRRLEIPLLMESLLSMVAFSLASRTSTWLMVGIAAVAINLVAVWRLKEIYVHRLFVNMAVIIATVILIFQVVPDPMGMMSSLGQYIIVILACKLFERKRNRDYVQMLALGTLLMFAAAMVSQELPIALLLAVYLMLVCYTAMVLTLKRGLDETARNLLATESDPPTAERLAWNMIRHWPGRPLRGRVVGMLLICLPSTPPTRSSCGFASKARTTSPGLSARCTCLAKRTTDTAGRGGRSPSRQGAAMRRWR